jgi:hypothetical protein
MRILSRLGLRLVAMVSLAAYLLANTNAIGCMEFPPTAKETKLVQTPSEKTSSNCKKCKHCSQSNKTDESSTSRASSGSGKCDEPHCPCCPADSNQKTCPCPGGCAFCSVAKVPLLSSLNYDVHRLVCLGVCRWTNSFQYVSPKFDSLDRPPRI